MNPLASLLQRGIFREFRPPDALRPLTRSRAASDGLQLTWLGTAGYIIRSASTCVAIDPYLSRLEPLSLLTQPLGSDLSQLRKYLPAHLDAVLCGHSHFDHLLDAPTISRLSDAPLLGSDTTCAFGAAAGLLPDRLLRVPSEGARFQIGDLDIQFVPSKHARLFCGHVPFEGHLQHAPPAPRLWNYKMGGAFGVFVRGAGVSVYHNGSADLVDVELREQHADVVLLGLAGWKVTPGYLERLLLTLRPRLVVPTHHDAFFAPFEAGVRLLPGVDFPRFLASTAHLLPRSQVIAPLYHETVCVPSTGAAYLVRRGDIARA